MFYDGKELEISKISTEDSTPDNGEIAADSHFSEDGMMKGANKKSIIEQ